MLVECKRTFKEISDSDEHIAPSVLSARLKLLESYHLISKRKLPENKKENIYLLTEKGLDLAPIIIEITLWGDKYLREFNDIDQIDGLEMDKSVMVEMLKQNYKSMTKRLLA